MSNPYILVLYYSRSGGTQNLAMHIARGVDKVAGMEARIRSVPPVSTVVERTAAAVPDEGAVFCSKGRSAQLQWIGSRQRDPFWQYGRANEVLY